MAMITYSWIKWRWLDALPPYLQQMVVHSIPVIYWRWLEALTLIVTVNNVTFHTSCLLKMTWCPHINIYCALSDTPYPLPTEDGMNTLISTVNGLTLHMLSTEDVLKLCSQYLRSMVWHSLSVKMAWCPTPISTVMVWHSLRVIYWRGLYAPPNILFIWFDTPYVLSTEDDLMQPPQIAKSTLNGLTLPTCLLLKMAWCPHPDIYCKWSDTSYRLSTEDGLKPPTQHLL